MDWKTTGEAVGLSGVQGAAPEEGEGGSQLLHTIILQSQGRHINSTFPPLYHVLDFHCLTDKFTQIFSF